jgi:hypothetical protein
MLFEMRDLVWKEFSSCYRGTCAGRATSLGRDLGKLRTDLGKAFGLAAISAR